MKILLLAPCPFFQNRGTPIAIRLAAQVLAGAGHRIHILTYPEGEPVSIPQVSISRLPALPGLKNIKPGPSWKKLVYDLIMSVKLCGLIRKNRFDVIHAVEESAFMALAIKKIYRLPFVYDLDSSLSQQIAEKYRFLKLFPMVNLFMRIYRHFGKHFGLMTRKPGLQGCALIIYQKKRSLNLSFQSFRRFKI